VGRSAEAFERFEPGGPKRENKKRNATKKPPKGRDPRCAKEKNPKSHRVSAGWGSKSRG